MFFTGLVIAGLVGAIVGYGYYKRIFKANVPDELADPYLHIPTGSDFEAVTERLKSGNFIRNEDSFIWVAEQMNYKRDVMRAGRFKIEPGWSNRQLIAHLRGGKQAPVNVIFNNARLPEELAGKISKFIEADSLSIIQLLTDESYLREKGYRPETVISLFIPNTYEFFWNTNAEQFLERMIKEHDRFWSKNDRTAKAEKLNLTREEVYTIASIVERETTNNEEKPTIAGVYLNRIRKGMRLEADPTVVFANRDFTLKRVLYKHLEFDSPYNTYLYAGIPPGPISLASISSIDAVLNAEDHDYIFFVARGDGSGTHAFARTLAGHNRNISTYRKNLQLRGIR